MNAAAIGFAGIVIGGLISLIGTLRTSRTAQQTADVEGLKTLLGELREDRDDIRRQLAECRNRVATLERPP